MKNYRALMALVCAAMIVGCGKKEESEVAPPEFFTVKRVDLRDVMLQTGEVQPVVKVELKSEASGRIQRIPVKEGQRVNKGDTILTIDPQRLRNNKERTDLGVRKAALEREKVLRDLDNAKRLAETGTVSAVQLQDLQQQFELADISCKQQQLDLRDIVDQLDRTVVTSPMNGVLTALSVEEGEIAVSATSGFQSGTSIGTIADISRLEVISQIGEVDYVHLKSGQKVVVRPQAYEDRETWGTITFIALSAKKAANQDLGSFEVRVAVDSLVPGIAPGINVNVEFVILEKKDVLGVPYYFVEKMKGKAFVQVVDPKVKKGGSRRVPVEVGSTDYKNYEILSGLKEGDKVVFKERAEGKDGPPQAGQRPGGGARAGGRR